MNTQGELLWRAKCIANELVMQSAGWFHGHELTQEAYDAVKGKYGRSIANVYADLCDAIARAEERETVDIDTDR